MRLSEATNGTQHLEEGGWGVTGSDLNPTLISKVMFASQIVKFLITWFEDFLQGASEEIPLPRAPGDLHVISRTQQLPRQAIDCLSHSVWKYFILSAPGTSPALLKPCLENKKGNRHPKTPHSD